VKSADMKSRYGRVTPRVIREIEELAGKSNVSTEKHEIEGYSRDETPMAGSYPPQIIVKPTDTGQVSRLLAFATRRRIPVTPRGAGTGLSGGCVPVYGGILLSLERMNRILKIDGDNFMAIVEPGVSLADLHAELEERRLCYPLYPGEMSATIGGSVATNAGGTNAVKYGVTRHHVLGLEAVLPNGDVITTGGQFVKCSTGYDLTQLLAGSEGTLAVITRIILKLTTRLPKREVLFVPFASLQEAIDAVPEILGLKTPPIGLEFMERSIIEVVEKFLEIELPHHEHDAFLMIIMEGETVEETAGYFLSVEEICKRHGAKEALMPGSERAKRRLLEAREKFYSALKKFAPMEIIDVVVPRSEIARFVKRVKEIAKENEVPVIAYGHAGDGNVHLHPVCVDMSLDEWTRRLPRVMKEIYRAGVSFGGAISGEHGIGLVKKAYLPIGMSRELLNVMKGIKRAFDPYDILNPGKIFDLETQAAQPRRRRNIQN